jgi:hypothetical protein
MPNLNVDPHTASANRRLDFGGGTALPENRQMNLCDRVIKIACDHLEDPKWWAAVATTGALYYHEAVTKLTSGALLIIATIALTIFRSPAPSKRAAPAAGNNPPAPPAKDDPSTPKAPDRSPADKQNSAEGTSNVNNNQNNVKDDDNSILRELDIGTEDEDDIDNRPQTPPPAERTTAKAPNTPFRRALAMLDDATDIMPIISPMKQLGKIAVQAIQVQREFAAANNPLRIIEERKKQLSEANRILNLSGIEDLTELPDDLFDNLGDELKKGLTSDISGLKLTDYDVLKFATLQGVIAKNCGFTAVPTWLVTKKLDTLDLSYNQLGDNALLFGNPYGAKSVTLQHCGLTSIDHQYFVNSTKVNVSNNPGLSEEKGLRRVKNFTANYTLLNTGYNDSIVSGAGPSAAPGSTVEMQKM